MKYLFFLSCLHRKNTNISDLIEFSKKQGAIYLKVNEITKRGNAAINYDQRYKVDTKVLNGIHFNRDRANVLFREITYSLIDMVIVILV
jgi:hypothetical protein